MAAANSAVPVPSVATVFTIGGVQRSLRMASDCMARISRSTRSAPSRSLLLITKMSAISMIPALIVCTSSPMPGTRITTVTSASRTISTSSCPTPTVSIMIRSRPEPSSTAARSAVGHAADVNPRIAKVILHADAIAQNRSARIRAGRVDRDNADALIFFAIVLGELIDQSALARSGGARQPDDSRLARVRKERLEQVGPAGRAVLDRRDGTRQGAGVARAQTVDPCMDVLIQTVSVKQR